MKNYMTKTNNFNKKSKNMLQKYLMKIKKSQMYK